MHKTLIASFLIVACGAAYAGQDKSHGPSDGRSLLGMLAEWMYPQADFGGAQMSDAGTRTVQSLNARRC
jgi:hypothetical protein